MKIKMIVLDLDGTLLHDDKTISGYSKTIIQQCRKKGIKVIFATVRGTIHGVVPIELFDGYVIKSGALAYDNDVLVYKRAMLIDDMRGLFLACDKAGLEIVASDSYDGTCYTNFTVTEAWTTKHKKVDFAGISFHSDKIYMENITCKTASVIKNNLPKDVRLFISRDNTAFLSHEEAIKSMATMALANKWNIKKEEILCFGDDLVDIEILQYCGIGVAMDNALNEVKTAADYICDTNNNDGAAKWIEEHLLQAN